MSRIHEALRKASQETAAVRGNAADGGGGAEPVARPVLQGSEVNVAATTTALADPSELEALEDIIHSAHVVGDLPNPDALLVNPQRPREAPAEEFRTLRTRLNHIQSTSALRTLVVTSPSPAEGKSFTATNLAVMQAQLADKRILLADFDFRRPTVDKIFQVGCAPGIADYLAGKAKLKGILRRVQDSNLYLMTAGEPVSNPLELLNLKECAALIQGLRERFDWVILDSPPLLFAADANLLSTMCDGTILVVRIGETTFDSVGRALQSLCETNVLGIVVNGARRGELYSRYSYYYDQYYDRERDPSRAGETEPETPR